MRIVTYNVNGIRSAIGKGFLEWLAKIDADVVCLQEVKALPEQIPLMDFEMLGFQTFWYPAQKKGYSGVALFSKQRPDHVFYGMNHAASDAEGRFLRIDFGELTIASVYAPSGSSGEERQTFKFEVLDYLLPYLKKRMEENLPMILCGDINIAHKEIDLKNYKGNKKNSGFLPEERQWMTDLFEGVGWVDSYRKLHPDATDASYTWWSNRGQAYAKNVGWRLDYQIAHPSIKDKIAKASIYKAEKFSDHAPLIIDYMV